MTRPDSQLESALELDKTSSMNQQRLFVSFHIVTSNFFTFAKSNINITSQLSVF
jgi:hypothetical protein